MTELTPRPLVDALEAVDRVDDLRVVGEQQVVVFELRFDRVEHVLCMGLVGADEDDELTGADEHGPEAGGFCYRALSGAPRHCHGEEATFEDSLLDLGDDPEGVR